MSKVASGVVGWGRDRACRPKRQIFFRGRESVGLGSWRFGEGVGGAAF